MNGKQKMWKEMQGKYKDTDERIRDTVTALNLSGINTTASCEGHIDDGVAAPWVDIAVEMTEGLANLSKKADDLQESADHLFEEMQNYHEARRLLSEYETIKDQIWYVNLQETVELGNLLEEFYAKRAVKFRIKLVINVYGRGVGRLISQGGLYQEAFTKEMQAKYLEEYRQEMREFGLFLKGKWIIGTE